MRNAGSVDPSSDRAEIDAATLARAVRGDRDATRALVECYQRRVFALASRMLVGRGRPTIEDAAQDTFLQVFAKLASFDPGGPARLSTWILTFAARRAIDELRKMRPAVLAEVDRVSDVRSDERAIRKEMMAAIEAALRELSPALRAAFLLREYHGLDYAEIAAALEIDLGTVKSRLSRARAALRVRLAALHEEHP